MRRKKAMKDKQKERGKLPYSNSPLKREVRKFPTRVAMMRGIVERCLCLLSSAALGYWDSLETSDGTTPMRALLYYRPSLRLSIKSTISLISCTCGPSHRRAVRKSSKLTSRKCGIDERLVPVAEYKFGMPGLDGSFRRRRGPYGVAMLKTALEVAVKFQNWRIILLPIGYPFKIRSALKLPQRFPIIERNQFPKAGSANCGWRSQPLPRAAPRRALHLSAMSF